jgi:NADH dehydrogenase
MSALNASLQGPSHYLRTKGLGEDLVQRAHGPELAVTSFRPSVIFGARDSFTNRFAGLLRIAPGVFPLACPEARFQPVYVEDVARAFVRALDDHRTFGQRYNLCGPKVYTLRQLVEYIAGQIGKRVGVIGLNNTASWLQAAVMEFAPGKPFSLDNFRSLQADSVCPQGFPKVFGFEPASLEEMAPRYLSARDREARYTEFRGAARR